METHQTSLVSDLREWWQTLRENARKTAEDNRLHSDVWKKAEPLAKERKDREILARNAQCLQIQFIGEVSETQKTDFQNQLLVPYIKLNETDKLSFRHVYSKRTRNGFKFNLSQPGAEFERQFLESRARLLAHTMGIKIAVLLLADSPVGGEDGGRLITGSAESLFNRKNPLGMQIEAHVSNFLYPIDTVTPADILRDIRDQYDMLRLIIAARAMGHRLADERPQEKKLSNFYHIANQSLADIELPGLQDKRQKVQENLPLAWRYGAHGIIFLIDSMKKRYDEIYGEGYRMLHRVRVNRSPLHVLEPDSGNIRCAVRET